MKRYNPKEIEPKWQAEWEKSGIYRATEDSTKPKRYVLEYFPYPSGAAMHVGHVRNYTIGDAVARFYRMQGENVLHPMGWDAFGLPAENYAIKNNISPKQAIAENTSKFKKQLTQMGFSYDWSREINSSDPSYYKWTQWFFKLLFERGLAYQKESLQWWCDTDKTVLANEQVEAGKCWRCGNEVTKKPLKQWFFKITDYANRLVEDLEKLDWSDAIKSMQKNWIGKSKGAEIEFRVCHPELDSGSSKNVSAEADEKSDWIPDQAGNDTIRVFTTRPDTLFGATFMVLAPEHELVKKIATESQKAEVEAYIKQAQAKSDVERQETNREKTGVFTGAYAINPVNDEKIPIWIADYVLTGYGTGAIMAVPAHDERDFEFAKKFGLDILHVIDPVAVRDDAKERQTDLKKKKVVAVVSNEKDELLTINWGRLGGRLFIGGTQEGEETPETTAMREVTEETGYSDLEIEEVGKETFYYKYYAFSKKETHEIETTFVKLKLKSDRQQEQNLDESEKGNFEVEWVSKTQAGIDITEPLHRYGYEKFILNLCYSGEGVMVNSGKYDGMSSSEAREKIVEDLANEPVFVEDTVKENEPFVERQAITAIVKHWSEDKYIGLKWKTVDWETFITGGIEPGQTAEEAASREIQEETGYKNLRLVKSLGRNHAKFYHFPKQQNRFAHFECLYFELENGERDEIANDESALHEVVWLSKQEVEKFRLPASHRDIWEKLQNGQSTRSVAKEKVNYKIRDWLISRQRYWGAPIPIIHCEKDGAVAVQDDQLPVELPEVESYQPTGEGTSVLASVEDWVNTTCPKCGGPAKRETDTMDGFACSSWYFLRFADPHNDKEPFSKEKAKFWLPVDDYIGGAEHAVMHLLYARMWTKVMFDAGLIDFDEPFKALRNQGMILAPDGRKMSKSWGNVIAPDEIIDQGYGADAIRLMELFIGPWNQEAAWSVEGMGGCFRFLQRVWTLVQEFIEEITSRHSVLDTESSQEKSFVNETQNKLDSRLHGNDGLQQITHKTVKKITEDMKDMGFNTAIATLMAMTNDLYKIKAETGFTDQKQWQESLSVLVQLLSPFAPHITEELWQDLGNKTSVHITEWPTWDEKYLVSDSMKIVVQVNGKVRATIEVPSDSEKDTVIEAAKTNEKVAEYLSDNPVKKSIYVPNKLVNFVI